MLIQLLTSYHAEHESRLFPVVQAALDAGMPAIQFCWGQGSDRKMFATAERLRAMTARDGAQLIVNNRLDVALAVGADVLHVGQADAPVSLIRPLMPPSMRLGLTVSTLDELAEARRLEVDYYGVGPIHASRTHPAEPLGEATLASLAGHADRPIVAIGGVTHESIVGIAQAGASGFAVLGAVWRSEHPEREVRRLLKTWASLREAPGEAYFTTD